MIIDRGRLIDDTTVAALLAADGDAPVLVRTSQRVDVMAVLANAGASVTSTDRDTIEVVGLPANRIAQIVAAHGLALHALQTTRAASSRSISSAPTAGGAGDERGTSFRMGQGVRGRGRGSPTALFALTIGFSAFIASGSTTSPRGRSATTT